MKRHITTLSLLAAIVHGACAQVPAQSEDVILQGFYWNSQTVTGWTQLKSQAQSIGQYFTCVWLPPSSEAGDTNVGGTNVGYHPRMWSNQNSCWGTEQDLKALIGALHEQDVNVIADIVVNHRNGYANWGEFSEDDFGDFGKFQLTPAHICKDDELNTSAEAASDPNYGKCTGADDTGEGWAGARDLDHTSEYVQQAICAYLKWLKAEFGYDGWRYDFVKGFGGSYVGLYNDASEPYLSVGEMWDGSYDAVKAWIDATDSKSMAFDFPMKYAVLNDGLAKGNYAAMAWAENGTTPRPAGLIHHASTRGYAVTFVDNHDTYRDDSKFTGNVPQAYAFLLSSPGVPCVFWSHWRTNRTDINNQIKARRKVGIHSESLVEVTKSSTYYEAVAQGKRGSLIVRIGNAAPTAVPDGYALECSGTGWAFYTKMSDTPLLSLQQSPNADTRYFTLQGMPLPAKPNNPGLYVAARKNSARLVSVK